MFRLGLGAAGYGLIVVDYELRVTDKDLRVQGLCAIMD